MARLQTIDTAERERAILVGLAMKSRDGLGRAGERDGRTQLSGRERVDEYIEELALLADSAGAEVVESMVQERQNIDAAFFVGSGKAEEIAGKVEEKNIDVVIFDDDLSSVQIRNLERVIKCKIIDRSGLILDIFASRARTSEAKTQVELAQLQYMLPRLTRQWTHLSKQYGGIGTKGPGETQIETDRRAIRTRISHLKERLGRIDRERAEQRKGRDRFPRVALVGYTNAGKSTLLNWFSNAEVLVEDKLFATLDSTVRLVELSAAHKILLSDTVGFIRKLPHHLVASFKSTLDEVTEADILLHVVDVSHPLFEEQIAVVNDTLEDIGAHDKPTVIVFNKIDKTIDRSILASLTKQYPDSVFIAAARGINMNALNEKIMAILNRDTAEQTLKLSHADHHVISALHDMAEILDTQYEGDAIIIRFRINRVHAERLQKVLARASGG